MDLEDTIDFLNKTANHMDAIGEHSYYSDGLKETIKVIQELSKKRNEYLDTRIQDCIRIALLQAKLEASYILYKQHVNP